MMEQKIYKLLLEHKLLDKEIITKEEYQQLESSEDSNYYLYHLKVENVTRYYKCDISHLTKESINQHLEIIKIESLKKQEKYLQFFYILAIISIVVSIVGFVLSIV